MHPITGRWKLGLALSLVTTILWGSLPVALHALLATMPPLTVTWYRYSVSAALLGLFLYAQGKLPSSEKLRPLVRLLGIAGIAFAGNNVLFMFGLKYVGPSAAQVVIQLAPVMLIVAGVVVFREPFGVTQWLGVAVLISGMGLFFHRGVTAALTSPGVLIIVVSAAFWAGYAMAQKRLLRDLPSLVILWAAYLSGSVLLIPGIEPATALKLDAVEWCFLIYCCLNGLVAYGSFAEAMHHWETSRISAVLATTPLFTPAFSWIASRTWPERFHHQPLDWIQIAGAVMVACGSVLAALTLRRLVQSGSGSD